MCVFLGEILKIGITSHLYLIYFPPLALLSSWINLPRSPRLRFQSCRLVCYTVNKKNKNRPLLGSAVRWTRWKIFGHNLMSIKIKTKTEAQFVIRRFPDAGELLIHLKTSGGGHNCLWKSSLMPSSSKDKSCLMMMMSWVIIDTFYCLCEGVHFWIVVIFQEMWLANNYHTHCPMSKMLIYLHQLDAQEIFQWSTLNSSATSDSWFENNEQEMEAREAFHSTFHQHQRPGNLELLWSIREHNCNGVIMTF